MGKNKHILQVFTWSVEGGRTYGLVASSVANSECELIRLMARNGITKFRATCDAGNGYDLQIA